MSATPAALEQLARDTGRAAHPLDALRAMAALREELVALEPALVSRALAAGASWSTVAKALGISKQAAHKRHAKLRREGVPVDSGGPLHKVLVTSEARNSVRFARQEAQALGHPAVGTEHLLLGILRCERSPAVKALTAMGISIEDARAAVAPTLVEEAAPNGPATSEGTAPGSLGNEGGLTRHARQVLEQSLRETLDRGEGYIGVEHLLLALLRHEESGASQTLEHLGHRHQAVRAQLDRALAGESATALGEGA